MINKNKIKRIFIIFFIINFFYFIICQSYAGKIYQQIVTASVSSLQLELDEEKQIMVTVEPPSLGEKVGLVKYKVGYFDSSTGEDLNRRCKNILSVCYK